MRKRRTAPAASPKNIHERRVVGLLSERETLMNEISLRSRLGALPPMLAKARTLLTNFWARATWDTRSEILAAARMLLVLGAAQPALRTAKAGTRRAEKGAGGRQRKAGLARAPSKTADLA